MTLSHGDYLLIAMLTALLIMAVIILYRLIQYGGSGSISEISDLIHKNHVDSITRVEQNKNDLQHRLTQDLNAGLKDVRETIDQQASTGRKEQEARLQHTVQSLETRFDTLKTSIDTKMDNLSSTLSRSLREAREEQTLTLKNLSESTEKKMETLRQSVDSKLTQIQKDNAEKLDSIRRTVDEKLTGTLEKRLGESFKQVSERLEQVHRGLGEMQNLATGVGDLKKVLTNVKTRGTWGEMQLGSLLEQILSPEQYASNVVTRPDSNERVEFAIRLPGREKDPDKPVWLPIDAKFPKEDYERLLEATDQADPVAVESASRQLENRIKLEAKSIREKYVEPPYTTDFAILYLPAEGLYAEVLRRAGLQDFLQRECRVTLAGPTVLSALLNSLQMGFRTLAIEERSSEVWNVLGAVKTEFSKFGDILAKVEKKLREASNVVDMAHRRSRAIKRKLKDVAETPHLLEERPSGDQEDLSEQDSEETEELDSDPSQ